jgi:DNA-binding NarL/FixJ family response regulator
MPTRLQISPPCGHPEALTARERQVLGLLTYGLSDDAIAGELGISAITVRHHMAAIRDKLHCHNRVQVLLTAQAQGLL